MYQIIKDEIERIDIITGTRKNEQIFHTYKAQVELLMNISVKAYGKNIITETDNKSILDYGHNLLHRLT